MSESFALGIEVVLAEPPPALRAARTFGVLCNQASVEGTFRYSHELLADRFGKRLCALFGPQHGLWSEQQDNMIETPHSIEPRLGVPVHSLYADRRKPTPEMLDGIELLVVDLQDVGTRVYTFVWTLLLCLEACAEQGVRVLVLDRPNPLGGEVIEGPVLDPAFASFVGLLPIPMRHGLTIAELAQWFVEVRGIDCALEVAQMRGWHRSMLWSDLGRSWVPTSPNLPREEGVLLYPGQVLLEGTTFSEGRGTTTPFEVCGAPGIDGHALAHEMRALGVGPELALRPVRFAPTFHKFEGRSCGGLFLHARDPRAVRSYRATLALIAAVRRLRPETMGWRPPPYEYEETLMPIDILTGSAAAREAIDRGADASTLDALASVDTNSWWHATADHRLYD